MKQADPRAKLKRACSALPFNKGVHTWHARYCTHRLRSFWSNWNRWLERQFERINHLPRLLEWRRELLFESVNDGAPGLMPLHELQFFLGGAFSAPASLEAVEAIVAGQRDPVKCEEMQNYGDTWSVSVITTLSAPEMSLALGKVRRAQRALSKVVRTSRARRFQGTLQPQLRNWIHAASSQVDPGGHIEPGASERLFTGHRVECTALHLVRRSVVNYAPHALANTGFFLRVPLFCLSNNLQTVCDALLDPLGWHALDCARQAVDYRHSMLRDEWSLIAREAGPQHSH